MPDVARNNNGFIILTDAVIFGDGSILIHGSTGEPLGIWLKSVVTHRFAFILSDGTIILNDGIAISSDLSMRASWQESDGTSYSDSQVNQASGWTTNLKTGLISNGQIDLKFDDTFSSWRPRPDETITFGGFTINTFGELITPLGKTIKFGPNFFDQSQPGSGIVDAGEGMTFIEYQNILVEFQVNDERRFALFTPNTVTLQFLNQEYVLEGHSFQRLDQGQKLIDIGTRIVNLETGDISEKQSNGSSLQESVNLV
jgi:hypothetical protein